MYFSRVEIIDYKAVLEVLSALKKTDKIYQEHQLLWQLFKADSRQRFLYRAEANNQNSIASVYYLLSAEMPQQNHPAFRVTTKDFKPKLYQGQHLAFKLRANPVVTKQLVGKTHSTRHDIVMDAKYQHALNTCFDKGIILQDKANNKVYSLKYLLDQLRFSNKITDFKEFFNQQQQQVDQACKNWLIKRSEKNGFILKSVEHYAHLQHSLKYSKGNKANFSSIDYQGVLEVSNPKLFYEMLTNGLGPAKAFGCGLMLIRKL